MVLIYQKYEINKLILFRMIYKNLHLLNYDSWYLPLWKMKFTPMGKFTPG